MAKKSIGQYFKHFLRVKKALNTSSWTIKLMRPEENQYWFEADSLSKTNELASKSPSSLN